MTIDLLTVAFTPGKDTVTYSDTINVVVPGTTAAIINEGPVDALGGNDRIEGTLDGTIGDFVGVPNVAGILQVDELSTSDGRDKVIGKVDFARASAQQFGAFGIAGASDTAPPFDTGQSNDLVEGHARVEALAAGVFGLANLDLNTGDGRDTVAGKAEAIANGSDAALLAAGIFGGRVVVGEDLPDSDIVISLSGSSGTELQVEGKVGDNEISTGDGNDKVEGEATFQILDDSTALGVGILAANINTGSGRDKVGGTVEVAGGENSSAFAAAGIETSNLDTGDGNDGVTGSISLSAGVGGAALGVAGIRGSGIMTGSGRDAVEGTVSVEIGENGLASSVQGITAATIETGFGNDVVSGHAAVSAGAGGLVAVINGLSGTQVTTGDGRDRVEGTVSIDGDGLVDAFGTGIDFSTIDTGANDDKVVGTGADVAINGTSDGIVLSTINLGDGDDEVMARGASSGVRNVDIFGEDGDDTFDLQSGTGTVDGGDDNDLLMLAGNSGAFTFTDNGGLTGNISDGGVTNLNVANIEQFEFDDGRFDFGDLF